MLLAVILFFIFNPVAVLAVGGSDATIEFENPLDFDTVQELLPKILDNLQGIIVVLSLIFIVVGAILYITSAGDDKRMTTAKGAITAAVIGLAIGIAAPSFLKAIYDILGGTICSDITDLAAKAACEAATDSAPDIKTIAMNTLNFLLSLVGILGMIMLVVGGGMYLTSAGDEDRADKGKKIITYAIIGIIVALTALVTVRQIAAFFQ